MTGAVRLAYGQGVTRRLIGTTVALALAGCHVAPPTAPGEAAVACAAAPAEPTTTSAAAGPTLEATSDGSTGTTTGGPSERDLAAEAAELRRQAVVAQKYRRLVYASIPINLVGVGFGLFSIFSHVSRERILDGTRKFTFPSLREDALVRTRRNTIVGAAIGVPLLVTGLTLLIVGLKGPPKQQRVAVTADGLSVSF